MKSYVNIITYVCILHRKKNITIDFEIDLGPLYLSTQNLNARIVIYNGDHDVVAILKMNQGSTNHYFLVKINNRTKVVLIFDSTLDNDLMDQTTKAKILSYLKALHFVPQDTKNTNLRWSSLHGLQNGKAPVISPLFTIKWGPESIQMANKSIKIIIGNEEIGKRDINCTFAIVCQELK